MSYIDQIESVRRDNNTLWMDILRLAVKHAPEETKALLIEIDTNDRQISYFLRQVAEEL